MEEEEESRSIRRSKKMIRKRKHGDHRASCRSLRPMSNNHIILKSVVGELRSPLKERGRESRMRERGAKGRD